jgi:hypothetical protein
MVSKRVNSHRRDLGLTNEILIYSICFVELRESHLDKPGIHLLHCSVNKQLNLHNLNERC